MKWNSFECFIETLIFNVKFDSNSTSERKIEKLEKTINIPRMEINNNISYKNLWTISFAHMFNGQPRLVKLLKDMYLQM